VVVVAVSVVEVVEVVDTSVKPMEKGGTGAK
jgi:hypothetical protein